MKTCTISSSLKNKLLTFLKKHHKTDLVTAYLYFLESKNQLSPILFPKEKKIYKSLNDLIEKLEKEQKLWRETEIKIQFGEQGVNEQTKKIYICPFTGKVFGDNTHPNPQDAIYEWVSSCPENKEFVGGLRTKRFLVSEDPKIIQNYISKRKEPISKTVYSSVISGKLFNSKEAVIEDFKKNHIKHLTLQEVQNQNRFEIEESFLKFLQTELTEDKISTFVSALSEFNEFKPYLNRWLAD